MRILLLAVLFGPLEAKQRIKFGSSVEGPLMSRRAAFTSGVGWLGSILPAAAAVTATATLLPDDAAFRWSDAFLFVDQARWSMPELPPQTFWRFALAGAAAHVISETCFLPVYASKTLAQCDPQRYPEGLEGVKRVLTDAGGGWKALFRAWDTTILSNVIYGSLAFGMDEFFQRLIRDALAPEVADANAVPVLVAASLLASVIAAVAYSPFEALRIKIITAGALYDEEDPGVFAALGDAMRTPEGMDALYQATWPLVLEEGPYTAGTFIVYDVVSKWLLAAMPPTEADGFLVVSLIAGSIAGAASAILSHPIDTVVVRMLEEGPMSSSAATSNSAAAPLAGADSLAPLLDLPHPVALATATAATEDEPSSALGEDWSAWPSTLSLASEDSPSLRSSHGLTEAAPLSLGSFGATFASVVEQEGYGALFSGASTSAIFHGIMAALQFCLYEWLKESLHVAPADLLLYDAVRCDGFWC